MSKKQIYPKPTDLLPDFHLISSEGKQIRVSDYRGYKNLLLVFSANPGGNFLSSLANQYHEFVQENAEVLTVIHGSIKDAEYIKHNYHLPFPVLADENGKIHKIFGALRFAMAIYITDRFNEIYSVHRVGWDDSPPSIEKMLSKFQFIELQCPE